MMYIHDKNSRMYIFSESAHNIIKDMQVRAIMLPKDPSDVLAVVVQGSDVIKIKDMRDVIFAAILMDDNISLLTRFACFRIMHLIDINDLNQIDSLCRKRPYVEGMKILEGYLRHEKLFITPKG